ncbi:hypothetical protein SISNIDRAFT_458614 [Sistotremastrum niveocremeum HHB9708]|uniref:Uncharacterized protein n=1 Tax=Sistotremastrum niveocremeum HHB9708 TaxID=1314777 RepID=A0A164QHE1_9AGAM|nr:hypothetical protein SISNIDRAFT_458614 [Sistotremastrum niveocremeum HHB9708]
MDGANPLDNIDGNVAANFGFNGPLPPNFDMNQAMAAMAAAMGMDPNVPIDENILAMNDMLLDDLGMDPDLAMEEDMHDDVWADMDLDVGDGAPNAAGILPDGWNALMAQAAQLEAANDEAQALGRLSDNIGKSVEEIVGERLKLLRRAHDQEMMGFMGVAVGESGFSMHGFVAPAEPPVEGGKIIIEDYDEGVENKTGFKTIPSLLTRIRDLLRVFFNFKVGHLRTRDLNYCDFPQLFDVAYGLHEVGLTIQLDPSRLKALMEAAGAEIERVVLDEGLGMGPFRHLAKKYEAEMCDALGQGSAGSNPNEDGPNTSELILEKSEEDLASYASVYFYADIMVALLLDRSDNSDDHDRARRRTKAMQKLVLWSSNEDFRNLFGDCLSDAMRSVYWDTELCVEFCRAGGLASLIQDATNGAACCKMAQEEFRLLPDAAWKDQTEGALSVATKSLANITGGTRSRENFQILCAASYNIYKWYGIAPFERLSVTRKWSDSLMFYHIMKMLKKDEEEGKPQKTEAEWELLIRSLSKVPRSVDNLLRWSRGSSAERWSYLELYGCQNENCPHTIKFVRLREMRARGLREGGEAEMDESLEEWSKGLKGCDECHSAIYCSLDCKNEDRTSHERMCRYQRAREAGNLNIGPGGIPILV